MNRERPVAFYEMWTHQLTLAKLLDYCKNHINTDIIVDCSKENSIFCGELHPEGTVEAKDAFSNAVKETIAWNSMHSNRVILIVGNYKPNATEHVIDDIKINIHENPERYQPNVPRHEYAMQLGLFDEVHTWPNYFLTWNGYKIFKHAAKRLPDNGLDIQQLFILKIRQSKLHRILLLDELAKRDLLTRNMFTCIDPFNRLDEHMEAVGATTYNKGKFLIQSEEEMVDMYNEQPPGWRHTLIDVVSETHSSSHFYTEKTVWPLAYMKPFLIHGAQWQNRDLKKLGFVLFEELFDYTFDSIASPRQRTIALADELKRLQSLNLDYNQVYIQLMPKLEHNLRRLIELFDNDEYMPAPIKKYAHRLWKKQHASKKNAGRTVDIDPEMGTWLAYIDNDGRNVKAMDAVRSNPYLSGLYYGKL